MDADGRGGGPSTPPPSEGPRRGILTVDDPHRQADEGRTPHHGTGRGERAVARITWPGQRYAADHMAAATLCGQGPPHVNNARQEAAG